MEISTSFNWWLSNQLTGEPYTMLALPDSLLVGELTK
jgi:hypothetical protein